MYLVNVERHRTAGYNGIASVSLFMILSCSCNFFLHYLDLIFAEKI